MGQKDGGARCQPPRPGHRYARGQSDGSQLSQLLGLKRAVMEDKGGKTAERQLEWEVSGAKVC